MTLRRAVRSNSVGLGLFDDPLDFFEMPDAFGAFFLHKFLLDPLSFSAMAPVVIDSSTTRAGSTGTLTLAPASCLECKLAILATKWVCCMPSGENLQASVEMRLFLLVTSHIVNVE